MKRGSTWALLIALFFFFAIVGYVRDTGSIQGKELHRHNIQAVNAAGANKAQATAKAAQPTKAVAVPQDLKGKVIVLDPGHGGRDPGAVRGKVREQHVVLDVVLQLKKELQARGAKVFLTRKKNVYVSLEDRVLFSQKIKPDIFLSVHANSGSNSKTDGIEVFYYWRSGAQLAYPVFYALSCKLGTPARFVHKRALYVTHRNNVPAVLAEIGYLTNPSKRAKLSDRRYRKQVAAALAHGVSLYFKKNRAAMRPSLKTEGRTKNVNAGSVRHRVSGGSRVLRRIPPRHASGNEQVRGRRSVRTGSGVRHRVGSHSRLRRSGAGHSRNADRRLPHRTHRRRSVRP